MQRTYMQAQKAENLLKIVKALTAEIARKRWEQGAFAKAAVECGATWREVGAALGMSGQGAWQKYGPEPVQKIGPDFGGRDVTEKDYKDAGI